MGKREAVGEGKKEGRGEEGGEKGEGGKMVRKREEREKGEGKEERKWSTITRLLLFGVYLPSKPLWVVCISLESRFSILDLVL